LYRKKHYSKVDITAYIRELLFGHDCVIVPGFGGFICNYVPARIDKVTSTFHPPVKQISFNRNLNNNDGLLIGRISESAKLSYGDARNHVTDFVDSIRKRLSKGERVVFESIGTFMNNHEGNVQFEPDRDVNYHLDSYGLTSFNISPLEGYDVRKRVLSNGKREPAKRIPLRKIMWRAAVIIPLLTVLITVPLTTDIFKTKVQSTNLNPLASVEFESNKAAIDNGREETAGQPVEDESISTPAAEPENTEPAEVPDEVFCLVAGSFKSEANAESLMKMLEKDGFSPEMMNGPNGFYRVSAMKFSSLSAAELKKDSVGRKYPGTWVARIR
jgi:nucleoid DNA-binding protein